MMMLSRWKNGWSCSKGASNNLGKEIDED